MSQKVITFHYTLTNTKGETLDSSREHNQPMMFLESAGMIIPGLEAEILKLKVGDKKIINVKAIDAYGPQDPGLVIKVPRDKFPPKAQIKDGDRFQAGTPDEPGPVFTVVKAGLEEITLDGNHPLAGQDLTFDVEITDMRPATEEELAHGHPHGPDGHHHH